MVHTWVLDSLRGQGVADALMQACLQWCEQQHYQLVATCSYAVRWLERKRRLMAAPNLRLLLTETEGRRQK